MRSARCWESAKNPGLHLSGEQTGNMPGPEWMQIHHPRERWSSAQTANVSIGQGYTLVSPLQLAMAYAAAANGGTCYYPRLVDKVLNQDGTPVVDEKGKPVSFAPRIRADLRDEVSPQDIELVRRGLWKVVNEDGGTGGRARLKDVVVAGKTGTAQATDHGHEGKRGVVYLFRAIRSSQVCHRRDGAGRLRTRRRGRGPDRNAYSGTHYRPGRRKVRYAGRLARTRASP